MKTKIIFSFALCALALSCETYESPERVVKPESGDQYNYYSALYDAPEDKGQYRHPELTVAPSTYINCVNIAHHSERNSLSYTDEVADLGFKSFMTAQGAAGLINRAVERGEITQGVYFSLGDQYTGDQLALATLQSYGATDVGSCVPRQLIDGTYPEFSSVFKGYVLMNADGNIESSVYATVYAHIHSYAIIDVRDEAYYNAIAGTDATHYLHPSNRFDATQKTTQNAWDELKDECNNTALVLVSPQNGELRDFAITHGLFMINVDNSHSNLSLLNDVLAWLEPGSMIYGWESDVSGEDAFVNPISKYGHKMIPSDMMFNVALNSINYTSRQSNMTASVDNPVYMDLEGNLQKRLVSFYLSDGDNVQWMMNNFINSTYYLHSDATLVKMGFGIPSTTISMINPDQTRNIFAQQPAGTTLFEALGGGYPYVDVFGDSSPIGKEAAVALLAEEAAAHMRQRNVKVLGLITRNDSSSDDAKAAYKAYIEANDQLEGVVVIEYAPYAGGKGEIMWAENSAGYQIPIVTVRYSLWANGNVADNQGSPAEIAELVVASDAEENPFSIIAIHAWSGFSIDGTQGYDVGSSSSVHKGAGAANKCMELMSTSENDIKVVNLQELMWSIRMHYYPEQTEEILSSLI